VKRYSTSKRRLLVLGYNATLTTAVEAPRQPKRHFDQIKVCIPAHHLTHFFCPDGLLPLIQVKHPCLHRATGEAVKLLCISSFKSSRSSVLAGCECVVHLWGGGLYNFYARDFNTL